MTKETRPLTPKEQHILDNDLEYLKGLKVHVSNGKRYLGDGNKAYNVEWTIAESEFVRDWLIQFAVGDGTGINYLDKNRWMSKTNKGQGLVEVVDDNDHGRTLFIIPPIAAPNLTAKDLFMLRTGITMMNQNIADERKAYVTAKNTATAKYIATGLDKKKPSITELIPDHVYKKHGIVPLVEQQCFWIKDVLNKNVLKNTPEDHKTMYKVRDLLYKKHNKEQITHKEREFLDFISKGTIIWDDHDGTKEIENNDSGDDDFNPLEC